MRHTVSVSARIAAAALILAACATGPLFAHEGATGVVKARMDQMEDMGRAAKRIAQRLRTKRDAPANVRDAQSIRQAADNIPSLFPPGSANAHSEATRAVWRRWPQFLEAAGLLRREAEKLATVAADGTDADITAQFGAVTRSCSACHDAFRAKR